jgi:hypothetical protein
LPTGILPLNEFNLLYFKLENKLKIDILPAKHNPPMPTKACALAISGRDHRNMQVLDSQFCSSEYTNRLIEGINAACLLIKFRMNA